MITEREERLFARLDEINPYKHDPELIRRETANMILEDRRLFCFFLLGHSPEEHALSILTHLELETHALFIDLGCGIGEMSRLIHEQRPDIRQRGQNVNEDQLRLCPDYVYKMCYPLPDIPMSTGIAHGALLQYTLGHVRLDHTLCEVSRVLAPGGRLVIWDIITLGNPRQIIDTFAYMPWDLGRVQEEAKRFGLQPVTMQACDGIVAYRKFEKLIMDMKIIPYLQVWEKSRD